MPLFFRRVCRWKSPRLQVQTWPAPAAAVAVFCSLSSIGVSVWSAAARSWHVCPPQKPGGSCSLPCQWISQDLSRRSLGSAGIQRSTKSSSSSRHPFSNTAWFSCLANTAGLLHLEHTFCFCLSGCQLSVILLCSRRRKWMTVGKRQERELNQCVFKGHSLKLLSVFPLPVDSFRDCCYSCQFLRNLTTNSPRMDEDLMIWRWYMV